MPRRHYQRRTPPRPAPSGPDHKARLARISALSTTARTTWFGLLGLIAFMGVTLMAHRDADFFAFGAATELPLIGISVPTTLFFWVAPVILLANYGYFHLYLMALWDDLSADPPEIDGEPLAVQIDPWMVSHAVLWIRNYLRRDGSSPRRVMGVVTTLISLVLSWLLGLVALGFFWVRSWPLHDEALSLWILAWFVYGLWIAVATGWATFLLMRGVAREKAHATRIWTVGLGVIGALLLGHLTWEATEGRSAHFPAVVAEGAEPFADWLREDRRRSGEGDPDQDPLIPRKTEMERYRAAARALPVHPADLREARLTRRPGDWTDFDLWIRDGRREAKLATAEQDPLIPTAEEIRRYRLRMAALETPSLSGRDLRRADLGAAFLPGADLRDAALQGADLSRTQMRGADLSRAQMQGADLRWAEMQGAVLSDAQLQGADLRWAQIQRADLSKAHLQGVLLAGAQMQGADLREAQLQGAAPILAKLQGADLRGARMQGAVLRGAGLQGADTRWAQMQGADLEEAEIQGTDLRRADLSDANCAGARLRGALAHAASLLCAGLEASHVEGVTGNASTLLPDGLAVRTCLEPDDAILSETLALRSEDRRGALRAVLTCTEDEAPSPTGRTTWECRFARDFRRPPWGWDGMEQPDGIPYVAPCPAVAWRRDAPSP